MGERQPFRPPAKVQSDSAPEVLATDWIAIVQPVKGPWTLLLLTLAPRVPHYFSRLFPLAQELAETLGVRAVAARRDEAGEVECRLYDNDELVEEAVFVPGETFRRWHSSRRERPALDQVELSFVSELCAELGVLVPAGYPAVRADEVFFAAEEDQEIQRVDLLLPPAPAEETMVLEEDETVIFQAGDFDTAEGTSPGLPKEEAAPSAWGVKALWDRLFGGRG